MAPCCPEGGLLLDFCTTVAVAGEDTGEMSGRDDAALTNVEKIVRYAYDVFRAHRSTHGGDA